MEITAEFVWDVELKDDSTAEGGISHAGETVGEFCEEAGIKADASLDELNTALKECGIEPVKKFHVFKAYKDCASGILDSIKAHTEYVKYGQNVDCPAIVEDIRSMYSDELISDILANEVISSMAYNNICRDGADSIDKYTDGRYSSSVKEWAYEKVTSEDFNYEYIPASISIHDRSHPTIVNSLIEDYVKDVEMDKTADKPKSPKSVERE